MPPDHSTPGASDLDNSNDINSNDNSNNINIDTDSTDPGDPGDLGDLGDPGDSHSVIKIDGPAIFINLMDQLADDLALIAKPDLVSYEDDMLRDDWRE